MKRKLKSTISLLLGLGFGLGAASSAWSQSTLEEVMKERGLTQKDILAAAKTYTPTGGRDEHPVHAYPQVRGGVHPRALAGIRL